MTSYKEKLEKALSLATTLAEVDRIEERVLTSSQINRRTVDGRKLTKELQELINIKAKLLIKSSEPF